MSSTLYQLRCPECDHKVRAPFVRVGAVVTCASCRHRYRVGESLVTRQPRGSGDVSASSASSAVSSADAPRVDDRGDVIGLSGLSDKLRGARSRRGPDEPLPAASASPRRAGAGRARRRRLRSTYLLLFVLVLGVALLGGTIYLANARAGADAPANRPTAPTIEAAATQTPN